MTLFCLSFKYSLSCSGVAFLNKYLIVVKKVNAHSSKSLFAICKLVIGGLVKFSLVLLFLNSDAEFRNTGLERSESLAKDLEWFKAQGYAIPDPSSPGVSYAQYLEELSEKDPQALICHFYNIYFAHTAGGRMIGKKVISFSLRKKGIQAYFRSLSFSL